MADFEEVVSEQFYFENLIANPGFDVVVQDGVVYSDTLFGGNNTGISVSEVFSINDSSELSKLISIVIDDSLNFSDGCVTTADYLEKISENPQFNAFLSTYKEVNGELELDDSFDCWVVNYENNAFSRFNNYNFNSFCKMNDKYYAANELGLFKLGGDTDNGKDIHAKIVTGKIDISGLGSLSYVRDILLLQKSDGTLKLNIKANDGNIETYKLLNPSDEIIQSKVVLSQGRRAIFWQFELTNDEMTDFEIEGFRVYRVVTARVSS